MKHRPPFLSALLSASHMHRPVVGLVFGLGLALLGGCADVHWERAFYDGFQRCSPVRGGAHTESCGKGQAYDRYEQERGRLQADRPQPAAGTHPIEEKQL